MKISVAICTYNGEKYINEQIDSILNQSLKVDEIIVCDDGSKDKTLEILENYSKNNPNLFKIHQNEVNLRSVKNFEKAIKLCTGNFIFLSDQDDIWVLNKVEDYITFFISNPEIDVLASNGFCIDENGKIHDKYAIWDVPEFLREKEIEFDYYTLIAFVSNISTGASMAFRRKIISEIMPFPIIKDFYHDEWIALIASEKKSFSLLNEKYFYYRIHDKQQVGNVFYDKNDVEKQKLISLFNVANINLSFYLYKKRLKKLKSFEKLFKKLGLIENIHQEYFQKNLIDAIKFHLKLKNDLKKKYPIRTHILIVSDFILNKKRF